MNEMPELIRTEGFGKSIVTVSQMSEEERLAYIEKHPITSKQVNMAYDDLKTINQERKGISTLELDMAIYQKLAKDGMTDPEICSTLGFPAVKLRNWKKKHGLNGWIDIEVPPPPARIKPARKKPERKPVNKPVQETACQHKKTKVVDSRTIENGITRRRRKCLSCGERMNTYEVNEQDYERLNKVK